MIYSTVNHQKLPFSDPTHPPLWWRNTWMVPYTTVKKRCQKYPKIWQVLNIFTIKKLPCYEFLLNWKNSHNFLVPRMIELACKTFMPIQNLFLHRVISWSFFHSGTLKSLKSVEVFLFFLRKFSQLHILSPTQMKRKVLTKMEIMSQLHVYFNSTLNRELRVCKFSQNCALKRMNVY